MIVHLESSVFFLTFTIAIITSAFLYLKLIMQSWPWKRLAYLFILIPQNLNSVWRIYRLVSKICSYLSFSHCYTMMTRGARLSSFACKPFRAIKENNKSNWKGQFSCTEENVSTKCRLINYSFIETVNYVNWKQLDLCSLCHRNYAPSMKLV